MKKLTAIILCLVFASSLYAALSDELSISDGKEAVLLYQEKQQALWNAYNNSIIPFQEYQDKLAALFTENINSLTGAINYQVKDDELWRAFIGGKIFIDEYNEKTKDLHAAYDAKKSAVSDYRQKEATLWSSYTNGELSGEEYSGNLLALRTECGFIRISAEDNTNNQAPPSDLQSMTTEQLLQIRMATQAELILRSKATEFEVPVGVYEIGVDIPAGSYTLEMIDKYSGDMATVYTHESEAARRRGGYDESYDMNRRTGVVSIGKIILYDGEIIEVDFRPVRFKLYVGFSF